MLRLEVLKSCIPHKWKYLLDGVDNSDHAEMMDILSKKFGRARVVVDECTAEIRKMKVISSDQEFIDFELPRRRQASNMRTRYH